MEMRNLGRSGLKVSLAGLGCNNFGMTIDEGQTQKVVDTALASGINFFDTADIYGNGNSEVFLGRALGKRRQDAVIATKFGVPTGQDPNSKGGSRRYVLRAAEASLKRLGTDYIDVYLIHTPDIETPIAETLDALNSLVDQGKVRYIGCSNFAGFMISDAQWTAQTAGLRGFVTAQNEWSLLERKIESEVVPACAHHGLGIMPYFPLASGALTGKYKRGQAPSADSRYGSDQGGMFKSYYGHFIADATLQKVEALEKVAAQAGISLVELALSWLARNPVVSSVIAGATRPEQVESNAKSTKGSLSGEVVKAVDSVLAAA
jgi:aryl-alcohol dehydrogenase-like predicted oxidoreductase